MAPCIHLLCELNTISFAVVCFATSMAGLLLLIDTFDQSMMKAMAGKPLRDSFVMKLSEQLTENLRISERVKALNTLSPTSQADSAHYWIYVSDISSNILCIFFSCCDKSHCMYLYVEVLTCRLAEAIQPFYLVSPVLVTMPSEKQVKQCCNDLHIRDIPFSRQPHATSWHGKIAPGLSRYYKLTTGAVFSSISNLRCTYLAACCYLSLVLVYCSPQLMKITA